MADWILAAEADKIQDLIFRSAHLREVVGGSQLLTDFCKELPEALKVPKDYVVINDGGSFTIRFKSSNEAWSFGEKLAEAYRRTTGGSLTVAEPELVNGSCTAASERAQKKLRKAKCDLEGRTAATAQIPYSSFCASCGVELGEKHKKLHEQDLQAQYFCEHCLQKSLEWERERLGSFLAPFYEELGLAPYYKHVPLPEDVGKLDPRSYIAYLIADGNDMGQVFGKCRDCAQLTRLSNALTEVTRSSLAVVTKLLQGRAEDVWEKMGDKVPVLPLILGGDDSFVMLPARWALDFARRFVKEYEERLKAVFDELELSVTPPTIGVAVVICKMKYPHYLAHQRGEVLLKQAKQFGKVGAYSGQRETRSTIHFDVILGNRLPGEEATGEHRPTLRPYYAAGLDQPGMGISIQHLIDQRVRLRALPHRRLAQLRKLFDDIRYQDRKEVNVTMQQVERLIERILHVSDYDNPVAGALASLGGENELFPVDRPYEKNWSGHGMPDLLEAWDFAFDLEKTPSDYQGDF